MEHRVQESLGFTFSPGSLNSPHNRNSSVCSQSPHIDGGRQQGCIWTPSRKPNFFEDVIKVTALSFPIPSTMVPP